MKKTVKVLSAFCIAVLLATSLLGCGSGNQNDTKSSSTSSNDTSVQKTASTSSEPVTMRFSWWGADARHKATLAAIDLYKQKNPNVTIEAEYQGFDGYQQKIMTQLAGGSAPDLMQTDYPWLVDMSSQKDLLLDLNNQKSIDLTQFNDKVLKEFCSQKGKLLGLPMGTNGMGMLVNKAFMEKYSIFLDTEFTWDSLIEQGEKIHDKDKDAYLLGLDVGPGALEPIYYERYIFSKTGQYWLTNDFTIAASKADIVETLTTLKNLFDSGTALPLGEAQTFVGKLEQSPKWINGQIGTMIEWSGRVSAIKGPIKDNFGVMKPPIVKDGKETSIAFKPSMLLSINNVSANKEEAAKFANWLLNDTESALTLADVRSVPTSSIAQKTLNDAGKLDKDILSVVESTMKNPSKAPTSVVGNAEIVSVVADVAQKVVVAKITPDQGADEIIKRTQTKLDSLKAAKK